MGELIVTVNVATYEAQMLEGRNSRVVMIPFSGEATGKYFNGKIIANGIDTQITTADGFFLSARYILEGTDKNGKSAGCLLKTTEFLLTTVYRKFILTARNLLFLKVHG